MSGTTKDLSQREVERIGSMIKDKLGAAGDTEVIIEKLKQAGLTKLQTIHVLIVAFGRNRQVATSIVHQSSTWADIRERDQKAELKIIETIERISETENTKAARRSRKLH